MGEDDIKSKSDEEYSSRNNKGKKSGKAKRSYVRRTDIKEDFKQVTFQTSSTLKGVQHYVVDAQILKGEFTPRNNRRDVYLDIIDGKEKVLVLALATHPDIKAIRTVLEKNLNY